MAVLCLIELYFLQFELVLEFPNDFVAVLVFIFYFDGLRFFIFEQQFPGFCHLGCAEVDVPLFEGVVFVEVGDGEYVCLSREHFDVDYPDWRLWWELWVVIEVLVEVE